MATAHCNKLLLTLVLLAPCTWAGIYSWTDENGKRHFGDQPPPDRGAEEVKVRVNTYSSPSGILPNELLNPGADTIVVYTTQRCGYCKKAKAYLRQRQIAYTEYDVETSSRGRRDFARLKGRGVPIIMVGDQRMNGFSAARLEAMLKNAGYE